MVHAEDQGSERHVLGSGYEVGEERDRGYDAAAAGQDELAAEVGYTPAPKQVANLRTLDRPTCEIHSGLASKFCSALGQS